MQDPQPITLERHGPLRWTRPVRYDFAARQALAPLVASELPQACMSLPIAFLQQADAWLVVAVLGVPPDTNLCVASDGRWTGRYIPALFRGHPFSLGVSAQGAPTLCVDHASGLVHEGPEGERFFTEDGQIAPLISQLIKFLSSVEKSRQATVRACAALHQLGLLMPWTVKVKTSAGEKTLGGLFRINEAALNQLSAESLHELMQAGGMAMAYCQLLSMQHFANMIEGARQQQPKSTAAPQPDLGLAQQLFDKGQSDTIKFNW